MLIYLLLIISVIFFQSCNLNENKNEEYKNHEWFFNEKNDSYKKKKTGTFFIRDSSCLTYVLDTLNLLSFYDDAKWKLYCVNYKDTVFYSNYYCTKFRMPKYEIISEIPIHLEAIYSDNEYIDNIHSTNYKYYFSIFDFNVRKYTDSSLISNSNRNKNYVDYMLFCLHYNKSNPQEPVAFEIENIYILDTSTLENCRTDYIKKTILNTFQPEIIKYIRENSSRLHPWFQNEAKKRGLFDSAKYTPEWVEKEISLNKQKPKNCDEETIKTR